MIKRRRRQPYPTAALQHLPQLRRAGPLHELEVVFLWKNDVYGHASHGSHVEGGDERLLGQKVGCHDIDRMASATNCSQNRQHELVELQVRSIGNSPAKRLTDG